MEISAMEKIDLQGKGGPLCVCTHMCIFEG